MTIAKNQRKLVKYLDVNHQGRLNGRTTSSVLLWRDLQSVHRYSHLPIILLLGMATRMVRNGALLVTFVGVLGGSMLMEVAGAKLLTIQHYHGSS